MIRLKNGHEIGYQDDFDVFFKDLLRAIISESRRAASAADAGGDSPQDLYLREIMDNCIFVTHQLFELAKTNQDFARFMVTGFIFNSVIMSQPETPSAPDARKKGPGSDSIH